MNLVPETFSKYLLRHIDEDGAEYFTVKATGRSGMSHNGLARFVGVNQTAVSKLVKKVRNAEPAINSLHECLKPFAGKALRLQGYTDLQGGRDILEDGFCAAVVKYYAKWSKAKNDKAEQALEQIESLGMQFMQENAGELIQNIGMRRFIHKKTGWQPNYNCSESDNFEQQFTAHKERFAVRVLVTELHFELTSAIREWQKENRVSQKIYSDTLDTINQVIQGQKSREIKQNNNLPRSSSIRDYFDKLPLIDYLGIQRLAANFICNENMHPVEAVYKAGQLFLPPGHVPKPVPIVENVYKADRRLRAEKKNRELAAGIQLSLPLEI